MGSLRDWLPIGGITAGVVVIAAVLINSAEGRKTRYHQSCIDAGGVLLEHTRSVGKSTAYDYACIRADVVITLPPLH